MKIFILVATFFIIMIQERHCKCKDFKNENIYGSWICKPNNIQVKTTCSFKCTKGGNMGSMQIKCGQDGKWKMVCHEDYNLRMKDIEMYKANCEK